MAIACNKSKKSFEDESYLSLIEGYLPNKSISVGNCEIFLRLCKKKKSFLFGMTSRLLCLKNQFDAILYQNFEIFYRYMHF